MTVNEMSKRVGKTAELRIKNGMIITVKIIDARTVYGRTDFMVEPISGKGAVWVGRSSLAFNL